MFYLNSSLWIEERPLVNRRFTLWDYPHNPVRCVLLLNSSCVLRGAFWVQTSIFIIVLFSSSCIRIVGLLQILWNVAVIFIFSWVDTFKYAFRYTVCDRKVAFTAVIWFFYATVRLPKAFLWLHQTTCSLSSSAEMRWKKRKRLCCADRLMRWAQQHVATQKRRRWLFLRYDCRNCSLFLRLQWVV